MFEPVRGGTRGGQAEFKWSDVSADKDRENYLGHSINAPTGRWQKNKDVHWYNREVAQAEAERQEEIRKIKELEADALAIALGFEPAKKTTASTSSPTASRAADASPSASTKDGAAIKSEPKDEQRALEKEEKRRRKAERKEEKRARKEQRQLEHDRARPAIKDGRDDGRRRPVDRSRSRSPRRRPRSPHPRSISPRRRSISPRRRSISPRRPPPSHRRLSISPRRPRLDGRDHNPHRPRRVQSGSRTPPLPPPPREPRRESRIGNLDYDTADRVPERERDIRRWGITSRDEERGGRRY